MQLYTNSYALAKTVQCYLISADDVMVSDAHKFRRKSLSLRRFRKFWVGVNIIKEFLL
jgi:hypothetical protein